MVEFLDDNNKINILERSYELLFGIKCEYTCKINYSGRFSDYNANIRLFHSFGKKTLELGLSKKWVTISDEIVIGLIQELLLKLFKRKPCKEHTSDYINLYNTFVKNIHIATPKDKAEPILLNSFNRINEKYFYGQIERPNLIFSDGTNTLGHYNYKTDTIAITKKLIEDLELLDYVMYHEMLHKKLKFYGKNGKTFHHTSEFRNWEKRYPNQEIMEKRLGRLVAKHKRWWW